MQCSAVQCSVVRRYGGLLHLAESRQGSFGHGDQTGQVQGQVMGQVQGQVMGQVMGQVKGQVMG
jgi:hypothetical protein